MSEVTEQPATGDVLDPAQPIAAYNPIRAAIADLQERYGNLIFDVSTPKGLEDAKKARAAIRDPRYKVEHIRKELKAPALAYSRRIDDEAKEYTNALLAIETPIDEQIKARENQIEQDRQAKERAEAAERQRIADAIADIRETAVCAVGKSAEEIQDFIVALEGYVIDECSFGERLPDAVLAKNATLQQLRDMHAATVAKAEEAARLQAEREQAERVRQEQEAAAESLRLQQEELARQRREFEEQQEAARRAAEHATQTVPAMLNGLTEAETDATASVAGLVTAEPATDDDSVPFPTACTGKTHVLGVGSFYHLVGIEADSTPFVPTFADMVEVIAHFYGVERNVAEQWMRDACKEA